MIDDDFAWYLDDSGVAGVATGRTNAQIWQQKWRDAVDVAAHDPVVRGAVELARHQGLVLTHEQARSTGLRAADVRRLVRRGTWTAPRRNVLSVLPRPPADEPWPPSELPEPHGMRPEILATAVALVRPSTVISHESAAAIQNIALIGEPRRPILTAREGNGGGQPDALVHAAALHDNEVRPWFDAPVTDAARTVVDIARNSGSKGGLVAADSALHQRLVTPGQLVAALARAHRWPGVTIARRVVELASPRAESPLESLSRLLIVDGGLPVPELQIWVRTKWRSYRVDGLWPDRGVVLEADGMLKYRTTNALPDEKRRQEHLERAGYRVVRVTWDDIWNHPVETLARIAAALRLGGRTSGIR